MTSLTRVAVAVTLFGFGSTPAIPQEQEPNTRIQVQVNEVILPVTVTDDKGKFVSNLAAKDFRVLDEGRPQRLRFFSHNEKQPIVVGFLMDMSNNTRLHWKRYQDAVMELVWNLLPGEPRYSGYLLRQQRRTAGEHDHGFGQNHRQDSQHETGRRRGPVRRYLHGLHTA